MLSKFVVATYSDAETLLYGVRRAREENFRIYDVFAPYPIHGLDHAMGVRRSRLPWVTFLVGMLALAFALSFQFYTTVLDWPLNVGGKPDNSMLAFIPIAFEITVLGAGLATAAAFLARSGLRPAIRARTVDLSATDDAFVVALRCRQTAFDRNLVERLLFEHGAQTVAWKVLDL